MLKFTPHKYQRPIMHELKASSCFGVFSFPGSGKTVMTLDMIYNFRQPTLVVAPIEIMYTTWLKEPKKWEFSSDLKYTILHGKDKDTNFFKHAGVMFINPEGIQWLLNKVKTTKIFPWKILVVDESIRFKNPKSKRFKCLCKLVGTFDRRYILSGNPIPNNFLDIWSQVFLLDGGKRLGKSWYQFRNKYFYPTDYRRFNWVLKPGAEDEIIEAIGDICYFLDPSDELDLPEVVENNIKLSLPTSARKVYKSMEDDLFAQLDQGENVLAPNASASLMKCWQIANGFIYESTDDGNRETHYIHNILANQAEHIVEELNGQPCVIAYHFKEDLERLKKSFPTARIAQSGISKSELQSIEEDWNKDKIPVLIAYVSKLSHGLNLQHGSGCHVIFYCLTYNHDTYTQLIYRFKRQGAKFKRVIVHRLIVEDTVHESILLSLNRKERDSKGFLLALQEYRESLG